jgi:hypothetical protein
MSDALSATQLSMPLDLWEVSLRDGNIMQIYAHAYSETDGHYVFKALMEGVPRKEMPLVKIPAEAVAEVWSV